MFLPEHDGEMGEMETMGEMEMMEYFKGDL